MPLSTSSQCAILVLPPQPGGRRLSLPRLSLRSFMSPCSSSMERMSSLSLSMAVMKSATISAMILLVFPLSSLIVIGRSSFIRSSAAGASSLQMQLLCELTKRGILRKTECVSVILSDQNPYLEIM